MKGDETQFLAAISQADAGHATRAERDHRLISPAFLYPVWFPPGAARNKSARSASDFPKKKPERHRQQAEWRHKISPANSGNEQHGSANRT